MYFLSEFYFRGIVYVYSGVKILKSKEMEFFRKDLEEWITFEKF